jgi:hypothetical protein
MFSTAILLHGYLSRPLAPAPAPAAGISGRHPDPAALDARVAGGGRGGGRARNRQQVRLAKTVRQVEQRYAALREEDLMNLEASYNLANSENESPLRFGHAPGRRRLPERGCAMKSLLWVLALGTLLPAANVTRPALTAVELVNRRLKSLVPGEPYLLLGETHGVYLENYGAVFTASVNLVEGPNVTPFRPAISPATAPNCASASSTACQAAGDYAPVAASPRPPCSIRSRPTNRWCFPSPCPATIGGRLRPASQYVMQATRGALVNLQVNPSADPAAAAKTSA